jgi:hypothetical protein
MKKIVVLLFCFLISVNGSADEWPHQNISNAEFAIDVIDRTPINIVEELDNSLGKSTFLQIYEICKAKLLFIAGFIMIKLWLVFHLMLRGHVGEFGHQKIFGIPG